MKLTTYILLLFCSYIYSATIGYLPWNEKYIAMLNNNDIKGLSRIGHGYYLAVTHFYFLKENLEKMGHTFKIVRKNELNNLDLIISNDYVDSIYKYRKKTLLIAWEPTFIIPEHGNFKLLSRFLKVYTWNHFLCNGRKFNKHFSCSLIKEPIEPTAFSSKKLVTMVNNPNGHERVEIANFYEKNFPEEFCLYGQRGWEEYNLKIFKGYCNDKDLTLRDHKFLYCFENWKNNYHYISEKILDCFNNLCVPIYSGSSHITDYIPKETFINAEDFNYDYEKIHNFISSMDENTYNTYIDAIKTFIRSKEADNFNGNIYNQSLLNSVLECLQILRK
jgi:hypothetical protein